MESEAIAFKTGGDLAQHWDLSLFVDCDSSVLGWIDGEVEPLTFHHGDAVCLSSRVQGHDGGQIAVKETNKLDWLHCDFVDRIVKTCRSISFCRFVDTI